VEDDRELEEVGYRVVVDGVGRGWCVGGGTDMLFRCRLSTSLAIRRVR
jgi:hypothetical protein